MQIVMTTVVCCWAHLMTPTDPTKTSPVLGVSRNQHSLSVPVLCKQCCWMSCVFLLGRHSWEYRGVLLSYHLLRTKT